MITYGFCLSNLYNSSQFSETFQSLMGDGVYPTLDQLEVTSQSSMTLKVLSGFALLQGRYFKTTLPLEITIATPHNHFDRYDTVVIQANLDKRTIELRISQGLASATPIPPEPIRNSHTYEIVLSSVLVRRGTTQILGSDLIDTRDDPLLCGKITPLSNLSSKVVRVFNFFKSGIDEELNEILGLSQNLVQEGDNVVNQIEIALNESGISEKVGTIKTLFTPPLPLNEWLECNGGVIPPTYPSLISLIGTNLPQLNLAPTTFKSWIYSGPPLN